MTQSWKRWWLRRKPGRFPIIGYDCGHGFLFEGLEEAEKKRKKSEMKQRDKVRKIREAELRSNICLFVEEIKESE